MSDELVFASAERGLAGCIFSPSTREPSGTGILFIHGLGSHQRGYHRRATAAAENLGATCLTFDLSGHGQSGVSLERFSPRDHLADSVAAFDTLGRSPDVDPSQIGVCAASYGAYLAALLISQRPARSLLLRAPGLYPDRDLDLAGGAKLSSPETPDTATALSGLTRYDGEVLVLESERDETIPHVIIEAYLSACPSGRHRVLPQAGHRLSDDAWKAMFIEIIVEWFGETLTARIPSTSLGKSTLRGGGDARRVDSRGG